MTRELHELLRRLETARGGESRRSICKRLGINESSMSNWAMTEYRDRYKYHPIDDTYTKILRDYFNQPQETPSEGVDIRQTEDGMRITGTVSHAIMTYDQVYEHFKIDPDQWEVVDLSCKAYTMGQKLDTFDRVAGYEKPQRVSHPHVVQLYSIGIKLKPRRQAQAVIRAAESLIERMAGIEIVVTARPRVDKGEPHLLVFNIQDPHIGKSAVFENWTVDEATRVHNTAVQNLIEYVPDVHLARCLYYVGGDLTHVDNANGTTTKGTQVESSDTFENQFDAACHLSVNTAVVLEQIADAVDMGLVRGNHGWNADYGIVRFVDAWFRGNDNVNVVVGREGLLPYEFGQNFILGVHGDKSKPDAAAMSLAMLFKEAWGRTSYREIHQGHDHRKMSGRFLPIYDEEHGVIVRRCGALSPTDGYHLQHSFLGGLRSAECYLYGIESGPRSVIQYNHRGDIEIDWGWVGKSG